jgi:hypothetical protein
MKISLRMIPSCLVLSLLLYSCGEKEDDETNSGLNLAFVSEAANSLPQIKVADSSLKLMATGNINTTGLASFFKQECFMPGSDGSSYSGFCPEDVREEIDAAIASGEGIGEGTTVFSKYKLTSLTLIGLIYHAQLYSQGPGLSNDCESYEANDLATANAPSYSGGSDPDKFIIDYGTMLHCVKKQPETEGATYSTFGYNDDADNPAIANLTTRYGLPYNGESDRQTDIFQVYLGIDKDTTAEAEPTPTFLAFNFVSAGGLRSIILSNLVNHRFAVRYASASQQIVAVGTGGVDEDTGEAITGYYMAKDITSDATYCVNNATGDYDDTSYTDCQTDIDFWDTISASEVSDFLGINSEDAANAANFLSFFADTEALGAAAIPSDDYAADKADNFPSAVE